MKKAKSIALWAIQSLLALSLIWSAWMKLFTPTSHLAQMWSWAGEVSDALVKFTGIVDLTGALGLILPGIFNIKSRLTAIAALGVVLLMICAIIFHVARGEASSIGVNIVFLALASVIWWYRRR
ncbi:DoxX family protein [Chryseolinea sp. T2]|uniref:DoxX family protein n=1 Tax=Chryseolinea sp. T2 TaxID=3129255 RepID=UPI0030778259